MTHTVDVGPLVVVGVVLTGAGFLFGVLVGGEVQKRILRGHEGTRADTLRRLRAQRARSITRRRLQLFGPPPLWPVPEPRPPADEQDRWWRRHPGEPVDRSPDQGSVP